ncbi:hypothetical protein DFQ29_000365, partial [Apophysomyces sp. BC1021]
EKLDENNDRWSAVFLSGVMPFSTAKWPAVVTYIVASFIFLVFSGELLWSKETS